MRWMTLVLCAVAVAPFAGCGHPLDTQDGLVLYEDRICDASIECVLIPAWCSCQSGGKNYAVNSSAVEAIDARREPALCSTIISDDRTCRAEGAKCHQGLCELDYGD